MPKLDRASLGKLREEKKVSGGKPEGDEIRIVVGMGTCGIAAGSKTTLKAFEDALAGQEKYKVSLKKSGCMGLCYAEPTVEVSVPGMPSVIYGNVDEETAKKIINKHVYRKIFLNNHIYDRPAPDILEDVKE